MSNCIHQLRRAFTLLEILVTITIMAVIASVVAPILGDDNRVRLMAASSVLTSDIELAQVMTISYPGEPVVVRFDAPNQTYWLAYASDPETPIARTDNGLPYIVVMGQGRTSSAQGVTFTLDQIDSDILAFDAAGGLIDFSASASIQLRCDDQPLTISISPDTGTTTLSSKPSEEAKD